MNRGSEEAANAKIRGTGPENRGFEPENHAVGSKAEGLAGNAGPEVLPGRECTPRLSDREEPPQGEGAFAPNGRPLRFFIGPLLEEPEAARLVTEEDRRQAAAFSSARRREFLTWRAFLYRELGTPVNITYEASGAPRLTPPHPFQPLHIGVSHCRTHAAVCWSGSRCAVDIELVGRNFEKVRSRYLTPGEANLCTRPDWLCIAWCAKECLYKLAGEQSLDLLRDLHLHAASFFDTPSCPTENNASETCRTNDNRPLRALGTLRGSIRNRPVTLRILSLGPVRIVLSE